MNPMTKEQFRALRKKGYTIEFVDRGEDITASVIPPPAIGDAVIMIGPASCIGKKIKVRYMPFGGTVTLTPSPSPFLYDFTANPHPLVSPMIASILGMGMAAS